MLVPIGSEQDGYAHTVLRRIKHKGSAASRAAGSDKGDDIVVLRAGAVSSSF